jgi:hypothetical protein
MTGNETLSVVHAYHDGWTSKNFDAAISLLSAGLETEVPINDYPTKASFAQALNSFGSLVTRVELLSEMSAGNEAMILYDMDVEQLGTIRVAEHYAIADGKIARLRQIHDTAAFRTPTTT